MIGSGESLPTHGAYVRLVDAAVVGADMVRHAVLPFEPLLADGTLERLLVRVRQLVAVEVVHVSEGLATHVTSVVLFHRLGGLLGDALLLLLLVLHGRHDAGARRR